MSGTLSSPRQRLFFGAITPVLKLDDVAFGISGVHHMKSSDSRNHVPADAADRASAICTYFRQCFRDVGDSESQMAESGLIDDGQSCLRHRVVAEYLEC